MTPALQTEDLIAQLEAISQAIGSTRFMDPPDGGDVSLAEQVSRILEALRTAERERDEARLALDAEAPIVAAYIAEHRSEEGKPVGIVGDWLRLVKRESDKAKAATARAEAAESALSARSREVERLREALRPFAAVAEHDIGHDEADADRFHPMHPSYSRAPSITVGDFRRARQALEAPHE